jgi:uncharacterized membrane protein
MIRNWILPATIGAMFAALAWYGTLVATPFVLMSTAMDRIGRGAPVNQFGFGKLATADNQPIVRPSPDLVYSSCVFDVSDGPVLIDVPAVPDSYWSVSIFDARTDVAKVISVRENGGNPARIVLHHEDMQLEMVPDYEPVALKYTKGIALIRILLKDAAQYAAVDAIRRKSTCKRG